MPLYASAIGWANFWDYPHNTPTLATDGYNGDDMIVRDVRLKRGSGGLPPRLNPHRGAGRSRRSAATALAMSP